MDVFEELVASTPRPIEFFMLERETLFWTTSGPFTVLSAE